MALEIRLNRVSRTYRPWETVAGVVVIGTGADLAHSGLVLRAQGSVAPQVSASTVGIFEAFYSSVKPVTVFQEEILLTKETIPKGTTELPFEFELAPMGGVALAETYHGVYINTTYDIAVSMERSGFKRSLSTQLAFVVEVPSSTDGVTADPVEINLDPSVLENIKQSSVSHLPPFRISGRLDQTNAYLDKAFTGELVVHESESAIKSIELQLVRVETITYAEGRAREATEIQNLQLADGDVTRDLAIPIHMLFPRLFTCPTSVGEEFSVEFEINVIVLFTDAYMITENFPITLLR